MKYLIPVVLLALTYSCNQSGQQDKLLSKNNIENSNLDYAKGFNIQDTGRQKLVTIKNPWQGASNIEYKYLLINEKEKLPEIERGVRIIKTPIKRVICLSTTHIAFLDVLEETESIVSVSGTNYVNNVNIRKRIEKNEIQDVGYDNSLNYELIASLKPDLVVTYGVGGQVAGYTQKLNDLGIQTMIIAEYLENHPLGKLEWIKLIAALYEKDELADSYFNKVTSEYNNLLGITKVIDSKPKILLGLPWKGSWYVPGGSSFLAKMIDDAGGEYIWQDNDSRESLPFSIESIFANASGAEIWINTGTANSKKDILKTDERFKEFSPFNNAKIYNNNLQLNEWGGNNYWEGGLVEPHIVLKDMIKIFHPELLPGHELVYYKIIE